MPELREFEQMASLITVAGFCAMDAFANPCPAGRTQLYEALADERPGWGRLMRKMLDAEVEVEEAFPFEEVGIFAAIKANEILRGAGEILRPRRGAVNAFPEALRERSRACPPHVPFLLPNLGEAQGASQDPPSKLVEEAGEARQRRNDVGGLAS